MNRPPRTHVYVDGFNLYYRALRGTPYRWLDLSAVCKVLLPNNDIRSIGYFTARVSNRPGDPGQATRQQMYLRALATDPLIHVEFGQFLTNKIRAHLVNPPLRGPKTVEVWRTSEKGSDVNLATRLLIDAYRKRCEVAVLVSNDSDLAGPLRTVRDELGLRVGVLDPSPRANKTLHAASTFYKHIRTGALASNQFATTLRDSRGQFSKPSRW
ncbi:MAG: NYN domain-containing protein [Chloroflexi bacterium]|nr:NYN domain-containing protein [Chloroflexota bacterium]